MSQRLDSLKRFVELSCIKLTVEQTKRLQSTEMFGENIVSARNADNWKVHHRIASHGFSTGNLELMCKNTCEACDLLETTKWNEEIKKTGSVMLNANEDMTSITLHVLSKSKSYVELRLIC